MSWNHRHPHAKQISQRHHKNNILILRLRYLALRLNWLALLLFALPPSTPFWINVCFWNWTYAWEGILSCSPLFLLFLPLMILPEISHPNGNPLFLVRTHFFFNAVIWRLFKSASNVGCWTFAMAIWPFKYIELLLNWSNVRLWLCLALMDH